MLILVGMSFPVPAGRDMLEPRDSLVDSRFDRSPAVEPGLRPRLPSPTMDDGLDAAGQRRVVASLIGDDYSYEEFTRRSVVAPQRLKIRKVTPASQKNTAHGIDIWFVAYDDKSVGGLASAVKSMGMGKPLSKAHLEKRGIETSAGSREVYRHVEFRFLEKVHLRTTVRMAWTGAKESLLISAETDQRFLGDSEFPNQWQPVVREGDVRVLGRANHWEGVKFYMKITKLAEPAGALFVEQHIIFAEPTGWFEGANLLRSKLPHVVQDVVRTTRQEWAGSRGK